MNTNIQKQTEELRLEWVPPELLELNLSQTSKNFIQCDGIGVPGEDYACFS